MSYINLSNKQISNSDLPIYFKNIKDKSKVVLLDLSNNNFNYISRNLFVEFVNLKELNLSCNYLKTLSNVILPDNINVLNFSHNIDLIDVKNIKFPKNLIILNLFNCINIGCNIKFPDELKVLNLGAIYSLTNNNFKFPDNLEILILNDNNIFSLDIFKLPKNLNCLYLDNNKLTTINIFNLPKSLTFLNLSNNLSLIEIINFIINDLKSIKLTGVSNNTIDLFKELFHNVNIIV